MPQDRRCPKIDDARLSMTRGKEGKDNKPTRPIGEQVNVGQFRAQAQPYDLRELERTRGLYTNCWLSDILASL